MSISAKKFFDAYSRFMMAGHMATVECAIALVVVFMIYGGLIEHSILNVSTAILLLLSGFTGLSRLMFVWQNTFLKNQLIKRQQRREGHQK